MPKKVNILESPLSFDPTTLALYLNAQLLETGTNNQWGTVNGSDKVTRWKDNGLGSENDFPQGTATKKPTRIDDGLKAGVNSVRFDSSKKQFLNATNTTGIMPEYTDDWSFFVPFKTSGNGNTMYIYDASNKDAPGQGYRVLLLSTGELLIQIKTTNSDFKAVQTTASYDDGNPHVAGIVVPQGSGNAGDIDIYVDDMENPVTKSIVFNDTLTGTTNHSNGVSLGGREDILTFEGDLGNVYHDLSLFDEATRKAIKTHAGF